MASVMREIIKKNLKNLDEMGRIGQQLVTERFSDKAVARQMSELYHWIVTKQNKPSFIYE